MVKPHLNSNVKQMLGEDFSKLLYEIASFVEPRIDIFESNRNLIISIDLAGASSEDFSIKSKKNTLLINGTIKNKHSVENMKIISRERFYGSFQREILIPEECDMEQVDAVFEKGILLITIPFYCNEKIDS